MIGTSTAEYIFIRGCILILHNIAPASLLYTALLLSPLPTSLSIHSLPLPVKAWLVAEATFFTVFFLPYKYYLQSPAIHPELPSREGRAELFERCNATVEDPEEYLSQWFLGAQKEHIKRDNVKEFVRWAFLNSEQAKSENEDEVEGYVDGMEKLLGRDILPGKGGAKSLRLTVDKVDCLHRSLLWYFCVWVVDTITYLSMLYSGFHFHRASLKRFFMLFPFRPLTVFSTYRSPVKHLTYWHRPHLSKDRLPILFIHGIGIGLYPYTEFLRNLKPVGRDDREVGIIALEIMPVSSRITHPALEKDVMVREIQAILKYHGWSRFVLVSHSYGSIISTHLLKSPLTAPLIGPIVLIDPVSFLLHLPDVAYNFTARQPVRANEYQLWYFGSKDIGVAHSLARSFFWSQNIMWREDLGVAGADGDKGRDVTVVLSGRDLIVDTKAVRRYLAASLSDGGIPNKAQGCMTNGNRKASITKARKQETGAWTGGKFTGSGLEVLWFEHLDHAQVFDSETTMRAVGKAIGAYSAKV